MSTVHPYVCLSVSMYVYMYVCPSIRMSVCPYVCPSVCLSIHPYVCLSVCQSVCMSVCMHVCLSVKTIRFWYETQNFIVHRSAIKTVNFWTKVKNNILLYSASLGRFAVNTFYNLSGGLFLVKIHCKQKQVHKPRMTCYSQTLTLTHTHARTDREFLLIVTA